MRFGFLSSTIKAIYYSARTSDTMCQMVFILKLSIFSATCFVSGNNDRHDNNARHHAISDEIFPIHESGLR